MCMCGKEGCTRMVQNEAGQWVFPERPSMQEAYPERFKNHVPYSGDYHNPPKAALLRGIIKNHNEGR